MKALPTLALTVLLTLTACSDQPEPRAVPDPLEGTITITPLEGPAPLEVSVDTTGITSPNGGIVRHEIDFDGQVTSDDPEATHAFEKPGWYTVNVTVEDDHSVTRDETFTITVWFGDDKPDDDQSPTP